MSRVHVIGVPTDYGADRRGVDMGPSAIRYAGLADGLAGAGVGCVDDGDLRVPHAEVRDPDTGDTGGHAKFLREVEEVSVELADRVAAVCADGGVPLVLGGDHSVAIGTLAGASRDADVGVVWFDAHGDFNTPDTTPSGNVHGMALAAALGRGAFADAAWARAPGLDASSVAMVGLRDLDPEERVAIRESEVTAYTISDVDERGIAAVVDDALTVAREGTDGLYVSFDLDFLDPGIAPGVGTPVRGGATYREAHAAMEAVADTGDLRALELVEVNPILDEHNETATLAAELAASAFGDRIL